MSHFLSGSWVLYRKRQAGYNLLNRLNMPPKKGSNDGNYMITTEETLLRSRRWVLITFTFSSGEKDKSDLCTTQFGRLRIRYSLLVLGASKQYLFMLVQKACKKLSHSSNLQISYHA